MKNQSSPLPEIDVDFCCEVNCDGLVEGRTMREEMNRMVADGNVAPFEVCYNSYYC